jgi:xylan 1,4-beta-xylosidase
MGISRRDFLRQIAAGVAYLATASLLPACTGIGRVREGAGPLQLTADVSRVMGSCDPKLWANIGFDPMYYHTVDPATQVVWNMIRESRAFRYIRCHNTFSDAAPQTPPDRIMGCRVYVEESDGTSRYDFRYLDQVLDIWTGAGLKPILEMDFMPDALADGPLKRNYTGGAINPPRDYAKWRELIYRTIRHLIDRYGAEEVRTWYFEIWNEPDWMEYFVDGADEEGGFTHQQVGRFLKMYDYFVDGATAADPSIKVGGPGLAVFDDFLKLFLDHITNGVNSVTGRRGSRADFISWHAYGRSEEIAERNRTRRAMVRGYPELADVELHQNEWGQTLIRGIDPTTPEVLSEYESAFLCRTIDNLLSDKASRIDLFLRWGDMLEGWRPMTRRFAGQAVPLPIFNAYLLLAKLGRERIEIKGTAGERTVGAFAARRDDNSAQIVVYRLEEDNPKSLGPPQEVELTVTGLKGHRLPLKVYRIDHEHGNAYRAWTAMGSPQSPTTLQVNYIVEKATLVAESSTLECPGGTGTLSLVLPPNGVALIALGGE